MNEDLKRDPKEVCYDICAKIYMARNITLDHDMIIKQLERIDYLLRTREDPFEEEE